MEMRSPNADVYYVTSADFINRFEYETRVPAHTLPQSPYVVSGFIDPVWEPDYAEQMVRSRSTIHRMLTFLESGTDFIVEHDQDVPDILHRIDRWYTSNEGAMQYGDKPTVAYAHRLLALRTIVYERLFLKVLNKNPYIKRAYLGSEPDIIRFLKFCPSFMRASGNAITDPIGALRNPPVTIPPLPDARKTQENSRHSNTAHMSEEERIMTAHSTNDYMSDFSM